MKQKIDPIAQAMQLLQFITQRRGQQADIAQGQERINLARKNARQQNEQFRQGLEWDKESARQKAQQFQEGMKWDRERAAMQQKQLEEEANRATVEAARRNIESERKFYSDEDYRKQMVERAQKQTEAANLGNLVEMLPSLQEQITLNQNKPGVVAQLQDRVRQIMSMVDKFNGFQPMQPMPIDPKTEGLNSIYLNRQ
jgi:hypothetical protein